MKYSRIKAAVRGRPAPSCYRHRLKNVAWFLTQITFCFIAAELLLSEADAPEATLPVLSCRESFRNSAPLFGGASVPAFLAS
jgi:hypothetical protein